MGRFLEWNPNNCVRALLVGAILIGFMVFLRLVSHPTAPFGLGLIGLSTIIMILCYPRDTFSIKKNARSQLLQFRVEGLQIWAAVVLVLAIFFGGDAIFRSTLDWNHFLLVPIVMFFGVVVLAWLHEEAGLRVNPIRASVWLFLILSWGYVLIEQYAHGQSVAVWRLVYLPVVTMTMFVDLYLSHKEFTLVPLPREGWMQPLVVWSPPIWVYLIHYGIVAFALLSVPLISQIEPFDKSVPDLFLVTGICAVLSVCAAAGHGTCLISNEITRQYDARK